MTVADWVAIWKRTGPILQQLEIDEYRSADVSNILMSLSDVNELAVKTHPPLPTSGLIEMQRLFAKLRKNETRS